MRSALCFAATATLLTLTAAQDANNVTCADGAHVIVARASGEARGFGIIGTVKDKILERIPGSNAVAVTYPATILDPFYTDSQPLGVGNMSELIRAYGDKCEGKKIVLLGYSQGAHVVGDVLLGNATASFPEFPGLDRKYVDLVSSAILMGDPAHTNLTNITGLNAAETPEGEDPIQVGNATMDGFFPRRNAERWAELGLQGKVQAYCDANDTYCDSGESLEVHTGYTIEYGDAAVDFVVRLWEENGASNDGNGGSNSSTPTSTGSETPSQTGTAEPTGFTGAAAKISGAQVGIWSAGILGLVLGLGL